MNPNKTTKLVFAALFLALGVAIPYSLHITGIDFGHTLLPMHIPVLLCGLFCGYRYGALCGLLVPFLSSCATGGNMPGLYPSAVAMAVELAVYGIVMGLLRKRNIFLCLISAMLAGRIASGLIKAVLMAAAGSKFMIAPFLTASFVTALPGILLQLVFIPVVLLVLKKHYHFSFLE